MNTDARREVEPYLQGFFTFKILRRDTVMVGECFSRLREAAVPSKPQELLARQKSITSQRTLIFCNTALKNMGLACLPSALDGGKWSVIFRFRRLSYRKKTQYPLDSRFTRRWKQSNTYPCHSRPVLYKWWYEYHWSYADRLVVCRET
jgi:hypothetical protein